VDSGLDEDETELGIAVLTVALQVLADGNSLLDHVVQILRNVGSIASALQNAEDLIASDTLDLGNAVGISEVHTDLRRGETLPGELAAVLDNLGGGDLEP